MAGIIPLPTTRVSGMLVRQRLLAQLQGDQLDLFRLQNQVSTGQRFTLPSEDAPAARRAMTLQRLLERKTQLRSNIQTGQSFLQSTDVSLNNVAGLLGDIRGVALGVAGTTSTDSERQAAITEINRAIEQLVSVGNTQFRGRYLFAGSQTNVEPYSYNGAYVTYHGDDQQVSSYSDLGVLFSTSAAGLEVFGGISGEVLGGVDLNPEVTADTPLSALRGGRGISPNGALQISDGTNSSIVDISRAATVGDVVKLIEANPPAGRKVTVDISGDGLTLQLNAGGGNLTVKEVASGKAASELGIFNAVGVPSGKLVGTPLDPIITKTTPVHSLLGSKASARLVSPGDNNDLIIRAAANGAQYDGATIQIVDDEPLRASPGVAPGSEYAVYRDTAHPAEASLRFSGFGNDLTVRATTPGTAYNDVSIMVTSDAGIGNAPTAVYDAAAKQLIITVDVDGSTTVEDVRTAINATGEFEAVSDESLEGAGSYNGAATISASDANNVQGNTGNSGGAANTLYVYVRNNASTAKNVAAAINSEGTFTAELDTLDATNATQIGARPVSLDATAVTEGGSGETLDLASGIRVVSGATTYTLTFEGANSVEDILNVINGSEAGLHAEINADGSGINVRSRLSGANLQIGENGGATATQLGIRSYAGATRLADLNHGVGVPTKRDSYQESPPAVVNDFTITLGSGAGAVDLDFDLSSAKTVQDVIDLINNRPENSPTPIVTARLNPTGNGIEITNAAGEPLTITSAEGSQAAEYLGLLGAGETTVTSASGVVAGDDRNYLETPSVFTTLIRLKDALASNDTAAIERAISGIDADLDRVTFARSEVGARQQSLDVTEQNLEDEDVQLRTALSDELEVDLVEAISNMTARQLSLEASMRVTSSILQVSLLNYL